MLDCGFAVFEAITWLLEPLAFGNLLEVFLGGGFDDHRDDGRIPDREIIVDPTNLVPSRILYRQ